jgi:uncharacterized protein
MAAPVYRFMHGLLAFQAVAGLALCLKYTAAGHAGRAVMNKRALVDLLRSRLDGLLAVYAFGSRVQGTADVQSDLDLAVLVQGYADPLVLWELAGIAADIAGCPVDLLDLRKASTVMQQQVLLGGERWWAGGAQAGLFECAMLSEKLELDKRRASLIRDIEREGRVYGR